MPTDRAPQLTIDATINATVTANSELQYDDSSSMLVDVTRLFEECAASLSYDNAILSTASFSLQDSMAALELMDPKMDCCEIPLSQVAAPYDCKQQRPQSIAITGEKQQQPLVDKMVFPRPAPLGLDDPIAPLPWDTLTFRDAAWIGLESLARLEAFLSGASAVESTFTCLYLHCPVLEDVKQRVTKSSADGNGSNCEVSLTERFYNMIIDSSSRKNHKQQLQHGEKFNHDKGYNDEGSDRSSASTVTPAQFAVFAMSLAFLELTDVVRNLCTNADIYEEEDFSVNTYGIAVYADRNEHTVVSLLEDAMAIFKDLNNKSSRRSEPVDASALDGDHIQAILLILRFQFDLLKACITMGGMSSANAIDAAIETKRVVLSGRQSLEQLRDILGRMRSRESDLDKALIRRTFDSFVNRPLVGNAPVRKVIFNNVEDSIPILINVLSEIDWSVCDLLIRGDTLGRIRRMLERVSSSSVNILSRSLIVLNLYFDEKLLGKMSMQELILHHMKQLAHAPEAVFQETYGEAFLNRLAKPVYDTLKLLTLNRNRQRTYMEGVMLQDWSALQQEAHAVDANFQKEACAGANKGTPPYFTHYVLATTLMLLDLHVTLGVEQKLFDGSHDLAVAYWYRDFLLSSQLNNSTTMRRMKMLAKSLELHEQQQHQQNQFESVKVSRGGKKKSSKHHTKKGTTTNGTKSESNATAKLEDMEDEVEILMLGVKRGLCRGLVRFIAALTQAGIIKPDRFEFTSHELRFSKRFESFAIFIQPPPLLYSDFCHGSDFSRVSHKDLVSSATDCFKASKEMIDKLIVQIAEIEPCYRPIQEEELRQLAKVCIGNSAFLQRLVQMADFTGKAKGTVSFDLSTHARFCTIKLA